MYKKLKLLLNSCKTFSPGELQTFISAAPNKKRLLVKVALILGVMGACQRYELHELKFEDVKDLKTALLVTIPKTNNNATRQFAVNGKYYKICKKYMKLHPKACFSSFFVNYHNGRCTVQNVDINTFANMGKEIAIYLDLPDPELYTVHCFYKNCTSILGAANGDIVTDITTLKQHDEWIPTRIAEAYIAPEMESSDEIEIKEEPFHAETIAEMKLEAEEHPVSNLHINDEDPISMDEANEDLQQTETLRLDSAESIHKTATSMFFRRASSENEGCLATRDSTAGCERKYALDAGVPQETESATAAIATSNNLHASSHENVRKRPINPTGIPDYETEESRYLSTPDLQRLLLIEQLRLTRLQTAFYEKRMKTLPQ